MTTHTKRPKTIFILLGLLTLLFFGWLAWRDILKYNLYYTAKETATREEWPETFERLYRLAQIDRHYYDVEQRLQQAAFSLSLQVPNETDLQLDADLTRYLADSGYHFTLTYVLDRSEEFIPAGDYSVSDEGMSDDAQAQAKVDIEAFFIDRFEITNGQYRRFMLETGSQSPSGWSDRDFPPGRVGLPVGGVSWEQAEAYCQWVGKRLPTEIEWQVARQILEELWEALSLPDPHLRSDNGSAVEHQAVGIRCARDYTGDGS